MQVVAAWNVTGLTAAKTSERFTALRRKLQVSQPPPGLTTDYHPEYFAANEAVGVKVIEPPALPTVCYPPLPSLFPAPTDSLID